MIKDKLLSEIKQYCELNNIEDVEGLVNKMLKQGFTIEKFGETPINTKGETKKKDSKPKRIEEPKTNKYRIDVKIEEEKVIEEVVKVRKEIKEDPNKDIYGE